MQYYSNTVWWMLMPSIQIRFHCGFAWQVKVEVEIVTWLWSFRILAESRDRTRCPVCHPWVTVSFYFSINIILSAFICSTLSTIEVLFLLLWQFLNTLRLNSDSGNYSDGSFFYSSPEHYIMSVLFCIFFSEICIALFSGSRTDMIDTVCMWGKMKPT